MTSSRRRWPVLVVVAAAVATVAVVAGIGPPWRPAAVLGFAGVCPGLAVVGPARLDDRVSEAVLAVATSVALIVLVSAALMYAGWWSAWRVLAVLVAVTVTGALVELRTPVGARS